MSIKAIAWAFEQGPLSPTNKLTLIALADNANDQGVCWPGWEHIAAKTGLSRASIYRAWKALETEQLLTVEKVKDGRELKRLSLRPEVSQGNPESQPETGSNKGTVKEPKDTPEVTPDVQEVWDHYLAVFTPKRPGKLGPSRVRQIKKALKEFDAPELKLAVEGLYEWRKTKPGDNTLRAIFETYKGSKPLADQIAFFISKAKGSSPSGGNFPSADRAIVSEHQRWVLRGHRRSDNEDAVKQAKESEEWLWEHGVVVVRRDGVAPSFRPRRDDEQREASSPPAAAAEIA